MPSKEQLDEVAKEIKSILLKTATSENEVSAIHQFIDEICVLSSPDACRLMLCLGIDLNTGAIEPEIIVQIIVKTLDKRVILREKSQSFPEDQKPGLLAALGNVIRETNNNYIFQSNFKAESYDPYVQVVSTSKLIQYTQDKTQSKLSEDNKRIYISSLFQRRMIPITRWKQNHSTVFVVHKEDYLRDAANGIDHVLDALGVDANLHEVLSGEYVALFYSSDFDREFFQPCTFHGNWGSFDESKSITNNPNPYFICYINEDRYGRTHSISGQKMPARERVHAGFNNSDKPYLFEYQRFGPIEKSDYQNKLPRSAQDAVAEAYQRYLKSKM